VYGVVVTADGDLDTISTQRLRKQGKPKARVREADQEQSFEVIAG
jgi:hypothetical protein